MESTGIDVKDLSEETKTLLTIMRHRQLVAVKLKSLAGILERRADVHDLSKLQEDEFSGFSQINKTAREHPYGSPEYRASIKAANTATGCVGLHNKRNSHHPEYHVRLEDIGFLDIIEMVIDWKAASETYSDSLGNFRKSLDVQAKRFDFTSEQWWLINEVADWLESL